jgi:hypothetical protein
MWRLASISFREFVDHVCDGATAMGADVTQGGLGLRPENGEFVGILSENCPVHCIYTCFPVEIKVNELPRIILH